MNKSYIFVSGIVFGLVCIGHLLRIAFGWPVVIGTFEVPMSISWLGALMAGGLVAWMITLVTKEEHRNP